MLLATASTLSNSKTRLPKIKEEVFSNWSINDKPKEEWTETDWLAKMIMSEVADSTDTESLRLVAITAIVHTKMLNCSVIEALTKPRAFSGVNNESYHWWKAEPTVTHKKIAIDLIKNGIKKDDPKIFAFCNLSLVPTSVANWFNSYKTYKKIGEVTYFLYEKK